VSRCFLIAGANWKRQPYKHANPNIFFIIVILKYITPPYRRSDGNLWCVCILDLSSSGNTILFGKAWPITDVADTTNSPATYPGASEYTTLDFGNPVLFLSNHASRD
jgi:hypothetical protein